MLNNIKLWYFEIIPMEMSFAFLTDTRVLSTGGKQMIIFAVFRNGQNDSQSCNLGPPLHCILYLNIFLTSKSIRHICFKNNVAENRWQ